MKVAKFNTDANTPKLEKIWGNRFSYTVLYKMQIGKTFLRVRCNLWRSLKNKNLALNIALLQNYSRKINNRGQNNMYKNNQYSNVYLIKIQTK